MAGIGSYPGGPRRRDERAPTVGEERAPGAPRVTAAEDIEAHIVEAQGDLRRRRRAKRILSGLIAAVVVAGGIGLVLGFRAHKTSEAITDERNAEGKPKGGFDPLFQTNRVLDELWKMEIKQRQPTPP
jgi:hypothetical protein